MVVLMSGECPMHQTRQPKLRYVRHAGGLLEGRVTRCTGISVINERRFLSIVELPSVQCQEHDVLVMRAKVMLPNIEG